MAEDKKVIVAGVAVMAVGAALLVYQQVKAAEPPPPPPGLANLHGRVTDAVTGERILNVLVTLNGLETLTNSAGNYAFTDLEPGEYALQFSKGGYETAVF